MALRHTSPDAEHYVLPVGEGRALFEREARRLLDMSGDEFLKRWDAGEYRDLPDSAETRRLMRVAYLIPFGRQLAR